MKKILPVLLAAVFLFILSACSGSAQYKDGVYRSEFSDFDNWGYKDFLEITVADGVVSSIKFDAVDAEGGLKSEDEQYKDEMNKVQGTYPAQYSADLINQYLAEKDLSKVVAVAGASFSSSNFKTLFEALESPMQKGKMDTVIMPVTTA